MTEQSKQHEIIEGNKLIAELSIIGYTILDDGSVIGRFGRLLKLHKGKCGYLQLNSWNNHIQKTYLVHRLVAMAFIPNPNNLKEVNHIDGNKLNNHVSNLEWVSRHDNIKHAFDAGLIKKHMVGKNGSKHHLSKAVIQYRLNGDVVFEYGSARDAAKISGVNYGTISKVLINKGKTAGGFIWRYKK